MVSEQKNELLYQYDKPIDWNISVFGNEYLMFVFDNICKVLKDNNLPLPFTTIHGSYSCKYNGGRAAAFKESRRNIEYKINKYNKEGIGVKMTFSNMNINSSTFEEEEMRWYLDVLNQNKGVHNGIICVNDDFAELVKKNYPDLDLVASHVKVELETKMGETDTVDYYNPKFDLYDIVVINTFRAFDDDFLSKITHPEKVEFIVNRSCTTNCPYAAYHHQLIDKLQGIKIDCNNDIKKFRSDIEFIKTKKKIDELLVKCTNAKMKNIKEKLCRQFINREEINYLLNTYGINHFKIEGRDLAAYEMYVNLNRFILNNSSIFDLIRIQDNDYREGLMKEKIRNNFIDY